MSLQTKIEFSFNSLDDFIRFVELLRGKEIDPKEIKNLTAALNLETDKLFDSITQNQEKK